MNKNEIALDVKNISKLYHLYNSPQDRLKEALHPFRKKYHKDFFALNDVSFSVKRGKSLGIIGKNGAGKSTILKIISNVLTPTSGSVTVNGAVSALLELGGGFNPEYSGIDNVYFYGSILGFTKKKISQQIDNILDFADIGDFINQPVKTYSSGMRARLAFAVTTTLEPEILIIDEVLAVGDAAFQRKCFARLERLKKNGTTILFVSHAMGMVEQICDNFIWFEKGEKILEGKAKGISGIYMKYIPMRNFDIEQLHRDYYFKKDSKKNDKRKIDATKDNSNDIINSLKNNNIDIQVPHIMADSEIQYNINGAKIIDPVVLNGDGDKVNILQTGQKYNFTYKVETYTNLESVNFGMAIKTKTGLRLGGGHYPKFMKGLDIVKAGRTLRVNFEFTCNLLPGDYFFNSGIFLLEKGEYAHRLIDCYFIKILNDKETPQGVGIVNYEINGYINKD